MKTAIVDDRHRIRIPDLKPGDIFAYELKGKIIKLIPVKPVEDEVPIVAPVRRKDGTYKWPAKLSREQIIAAIRADRDS